MNMKYEMLTFGWYMARLVVKKSSRKNTCHDEVVLHAQNLSVIPSSTTNPICKAYVITLIERYPSTFTTSTLIKLFKRKI